MTTATATRAIGIRAIAAPAIAARPIGIRAIATRAIATRPIGIRATLRTPPRAMCGPALRTPASAVRAGGDRTGEDAA
ncbi:hypothetical protein [Streptomyces avermitilis]|uniref:hypothetical protein n=1 Tax=Streptomyces avermitilis TaxID=33903 RepID=UPI0038035C5F